MTETSPIPGYYTAQQAAKKLGVSEARVRRLANIYGWEYCLSGLTKLFSAADVGRYIQARQHFRQLHET